MHAAGELGQPFEVVIGLGIDVDDQAAAPLGLIREQLRRDRLPGPERAGQQHRGRPAAARGLGEVELDRLRVPGDGVADIDAALRARAVAADRHQRAELLDRQHVGVVAHAPAVRARQVVEEQRRLQPERPVQRHGAEAVAQRLDAVLELLARRRADRQRDRGLQQRRALGRLQVGVELARELAVLLHRVRERAVRGGQLLGVGVVGVQHAPARLNQRVAVGDPARMHDDVDSERQPLQRPEQQLRATRKLAALRQRPHSQHRLPATTLGRIDHQRAVLLEDRLIRMPDQVGLQRLVGLLAVRRLDQQRTRTPVLVEPGLGDTTARRPSQQPLHLPRTRPPRRHARGDAAQHPLLLGLQRLELARGQRHRRGHAEQLLHAPARTVGRPQHPRTPAGRPLAAQLHRQVNLGRERAQLPQMRLVPLQIGAPRLRRLAARVQQPLGVLDIALRRIGTGRPPQREVRLHGERQPRQPTEPLALLRDRHERIRDRLQPVQRRPLGAAPDQHVLMQVAQRKATHRCTSITKPSRSASSRTGAPSPERPQTDRHDDRHARDRRTSPSPAR